MLLYNPEAVLTCLSITLRSRCTTNSNLRLVQHLCLTILSAYLNQFTQSLCSTALLKVFKHFEAQHTSPMVDKQLRNEHFTPAKTDHGQWNIYLKKEKKHQIHQVKCGMGTETLCCGFIFWFCQFTVNSLEAVEYPLVHESPCLSLIALPVVPAHLQKNELSQQMVVPALSILLSYKRTCKKYIMFKFLLLGVKNRKTAGHSDSGVFPLPFLQIRHVLTGHIWHLCCFFTAEKKEKQKKGREMERQNDIISENLRVK